MVVDETGTHHREKLGGSSIHFNRVLKGRIPSRVIDYLLQEGEFAPARRSRKADPGRLRGYKMSASIRERILEELGVERGRVKVDLFASPKDSQEELFMTESNSAWFYDWQKFCREGHYLWANPPFDELKKVVTKACLEPC